MATTVRVANPNLRDLAYWLYSEDAFSEETASLIEKWLPNVNRIRSSVALKIFAEKASQSDFVVVISGRPGGKLFTAISELSAKHSFTFLPVALISDVVHVGPISTKGCIACWQCWRDRESANHADPHSYRSLLEYHDTLQSDINCGYLPLFIPIVSHLVNVLMETHEKGGWVAKLNLQTKSITFHPVLGIHDCPNCSWSLPSVDAEDLRTIFAQESA